MAPWKVTKAPDRRLRLTGSQGPSSDTSPPAMSTNPPQLDPAPAGPFAINGMDRIIEHLYLGNLESAQDADLLARNGITHILSLLSPSTPFLLPLQLSTKVTRKLVELTDEAETNLLAFITPCLDFLETTLSSEPTNKVLVHCRAGVSRSASVVIAFLMKQGNLSFDEALETVRKARPRVHPNRGFRSQLGLLESVGFDMEVVGDIGTSVANIYDENEGKWGKKKKRKRLEEGMGRLRLADYDRMMLYEILKELEVSGRIQVKKGSGNHSMSNLDEVKKAVTLEESDQSEEAIERKDIHEPDDTLESNSIDTKPDGKP